jgi:tellurite resistance protein TerC
VTKLRQWLTEAIPYHWARRIAVSVIGGTLCLIGAAMIVLPGPALVVLPLGLGVLGLEYAWARRWLSRVKDTANGLVNGVRNAGPWHKPPPARPPGNPPPPPPPPVG